MHGIEKSYAMRPARFDEVTEAAQ